MPKSQDDAASKNNGEQRRGQTDPASHDRQPELGVIGGTETARVPTHLSEDDDLDDVGKASADSFPASDPPSRR